MKALIIPCYNRPSELRQCFESLAKAKWPLDTMCILIDDASGDPEAIALFRAFNIPGIDILRIVNQDNKGIKQNLLKGCDMAFKMGADIVINLDSDAIVKPDFFDRLLKGKIKDHILSGFNSKTRNRDGSERHPIIKEDNGLLFKKSLGGINLCFTRNEYEKYIRPSLEGAGNWDHQSSIRAFNDGHPMTCLSPSVVQHIASHSSMNHNEEPDTACDFCDIVLPNVTLFGADTKNYAGLIKAKEISSLDIQFGKTVMLTTPSINFASKQDYSRFMIKELDNWIETDFAIIIQHDGYIINSKAWDPRFLDYDYIGATWVYCDGMNVGNGGFSLRSKKLLHALANDPEIVQTHPEDHHICRTYRRRLESKWGVKFAPEEVANQFAIEAYSRTGIEGANRYSGQFGFHGYYVDFTGADLPHIPATPLYKVEVKAADRVATMRGFQLGAR